MTCCIRCAGRVPGAGILACWLWLLEQGLLYGTGVAVGTERLFQLRWDGRRCGLNRHPGSGDSLPAKLGRRPCIFLIFWIAVGSEAGLGMHRLGDPVTDNSTVAVVGGEQPVMQTVGETWLHPCRDLLPWNERFGALVLAFGGQQPFR